MTKRAAILARISDADLGETAGVDDQVRDMRGYVAARGWTLDEAHIMIENDTSAYKLDKRTGRTNRPKFHHANDLLRTRAVDVLVVLDIDRLARQPRDLEDTIDIVTASGFAVTCESLTGSCDLTSDSGVMIARIMCAAANKASADTARRVARARLRQAEAGQFGGGGRPYGFEPDGVTVRADEAAELVRMADGVLSGVSLAGIARDLNARGVPSTTGLDWRVTTVRDVLTRPRNVGWMVHRAGTGRKVYTEADRVGTAPWAPLLDLDVWQAVCHKIQNPARRTNGGEVTSKWIGSGAYRCICGDPMRVYRPTGREPIYRCSSTGKGKGSCGTCPQAALDAYVTEIVITLLSREETIRATIAPASAGIDVAALRSELLTLRQRQADLADAFADGEINRAALASGTKRLAVKIEDIERRLADVADRHPLADFVSTDDVERVWAGLSVAAKRLVIGKLVTVTVKPTGRGSRPALEDRFEIVPIV